MVDGWLGYSDNNATQPSWGLGLAELGKNQFQISTAVPEEQMTSK